MLANIVLHTPLGGVKRLFFFSESSHVAYQINGNEEENTVQATNYFAFLMRSKVIFI